MIKLFLNPVGRMGRRDFWIGFSGFVVFVFVMQIILDRLSDSLVGFFLSLIYLVLVFQILYSVYGKRLHDMGRSLWFLTGMIALTLILVIVVMMMFGGAEYFSEFAQYDRKEDIDPAEIERIQTAYQNRLQQGTLPLKYLLYGLWAAFTLWLGLSKPQAKDNQYGPYST
ncbi:DUF805 domain-containing protein [Litorimonas taeanensis]|nr:DUF805 domain-containing protein [Litorimonas taeanensis]